MEYRWQSHTGRWHGPLLTTPQPVHGGLTRGPLGGQTPLWINRDDRRILVTRIVGRYDVHRVAHWDGRDHFDITHHAWVVELVTGEHWALLRPVIAPTEWVGGRVAIRDHDGYRSFDPRIGPEPPGDLAAVQKWVARHE
jgi:hypothetical protein